MSDTGIPDASNSDLSNNAGKVVIPFPALPTLHSAHMELIRRQRENGITPPFFVDVDEFIQRGSATGVLLDADADREAAQGMLDYWSTILYREGHEPPDATLAEFDPDLAPTLDDALCPYVGLDAFRENNQTIFFGRQRTVEELIERLKQQRLLAVIGPSGSGKSSVVRAGLIPALHDGALPGSESWRDYPPIIPGADPLRSLARLLRPSDTRAGWVDEQIERFKQDAGHLARLLGEAGTTPAVLCIDQFEELFTLAEDESSRRAFIDNLLHLVDVSDAGHIVILTMRSDFEAFVTRVPELQARFAAARVQMTPLSAAELRETIERPAMMVGLKFETGVVDSLLQDILGEPAALPLLQFTLLKLWEHRSRNRVTLDAYQRLGGGRLALARSADEFYAGLIPEEQVTARRILLRMVRPGDGLEVTSNRIRRTTLYQASEATDRIDRVLQKLIQARLVRVTGGETPEDEQIEVAHEALVRNWPTLVDWLEDERSALNVRRRLEAKAIEWLRLGRGSSGLLDREQLLEAEHWLASSDAAYLGFDPALPELAVYSRAAIEEAEHEQEAARQRELQQARALAYEQQRRADSERQRAELEARTNKRLTWLFRALAVAAIIAVGAAILALYQAGRATFAQQQAEGAQQQAEGAQQQTELKNAQLQTAVAETNNARATAEANALRADNSAATAVGAQATTVALSQSSAQQQRLDRANLLAAVSSAVAENKPQLSLLLGVEALRVHLEANETPIVTATKALNQTLVGIGAAEYGLTGHTKPVTAVAISADGSRLLTGSADGSARLWNLTDANPGANVIQLPGTTAPIQAVAISPDGRRLIAGGEDGIVYVWETADPSAAPRALTGNKGPIKSLVVSPDSQWLITSGADTVVRVWNLTNPDSVSIQLSKHTQPVTAVAVGANSRVVLTSGADGIAYLWDLSARTPGNPTGSLAARPTSLNSAALSHDGNWAAIGGDDGTTHLWRVSGAAFSSSSPIVLPTGTISALAIDPKSRWITVGSPDGRISLWGLSSHRVQISLTGHSGPITGLAFSQDGGVLVTSSADGTARVWNLADANPSASARVLRGHEAKINALALTPDGRRLASGSDDSSARVWNLATPSLTENALPADPTKLAQLACSTAGRNLTTAEWDLYFGGKPHRPTCGT
jgi:WD40 repeat protein/cytoskeletal protein RodZ